MAVCNQTTCLLRPPHHSPLGGLYRQVSLYFRKSAPGSVILTSTRWSTKHWCRTLPCGLSVIYHCFHSIISKVWLKCEGYHSLIQDEWVWLQSSFKVDSETSNRKCKWKSHPITLNTSVCWVNGKVNRQKVVKWYNLITYFFHHIVKPLWTVCHETGAKGNSICSRTESPTWLKLVQSAAKRKGLHLSRQSLSDRSFQR